MATEKKYILAIDEKLFKKQRTDLDNVMAKKEMAIDEGTMTKREANSLEGIRNMLDSISDQLAENEQEPTYYLLSEKNTTRTIAIIKHDGIDYEAYFFKKVRQAIADHKSVGINDVHILTDKSSESFSFSVNVPGEGLRNMEEYSLS